MISFKPNTIYTSRKTTNNPEPHIPFLSSPSYLQPHSHVSKPPYRTLPYFTPLPSHTSVLHVATCGSHIAGSRNLLPLTPFAL